MIIPDVNLLLYAYDQASPFHKQAAAWLERCMSGTEPIGLAYPVLFGFLRIGTSARVFKQPMSIAEAVSHVNTWKNRSVTQILIPGNEYIDTARELLEAAGSAGANLVTDAQIAALSLQYKAVVHTADYDFLRFPKVRTKFPLNIN